MMSRTLYDHCIQRNDTTLLEQWDQKLNSLTPKGVSFGSHKKVFWRCKEGHSWQAQVKSRVSGCGCPVCAKRKIQPGVNDLGTTHPSLARQWHPEKNGALTPMEIPAGSHQKVWWHCSEGHDWQASPLSRSQNGTNCPYCAGKKVAVGENDLGSFHPVIAAQWHPTENGTLTPQAVSAFSNRKVFWLCPAGHTYKAVIASRTNHGTGCPYCSGKKVLAGFNDLSTTAPKVAAQWHPELNGQLSPQMVTAGSHKKIWWQCSQGHVWKAIVYSRTGAKQHGCPICAGTTKMTHRPAAAGTKKAVSSL